MKDTGQLTQSDVDTLPAMTVQAPLCIETYKHQVKNLTNMCEMCGHMDSALSVVILDMHEHVEEKRTKYDENLDDCWFFVWIC